MNECSYCGDPDNAADLWPGDDEVVCTAGGCGFRFAYGDIDPGDIAFGFSIVTEDTEL
jgi:hypothetical protein